MTGNKAVIEEMWQLMFELKAQFEYMDQNMVVGKEDPKNGEHALAHYDKPIFASLSHMQDLVERLRKNKCGLAKVFVAIHSDGAIDIEGTAPLDVTVARPDSNDPNSVIQRETLSPLPEQEFLQFVHDTLASALQSGTVRPEAINT